MAGLVGKLFRRGRGMMKCCMCADVFDVGYEMPNGDYVCATHECCYEYCRYEGKRITQESEGERYEIE